MKKLQLIWISAVLLLSACGRAVVPATTSVSPAKTSKPPVSLTQTRTPFQSVASTKTAVPLTETPTSVPFTPTVTLTAAPSFPLAGRGPDAFAAGINPLTGLAVSNPALLDRRPIVVKVENLPRIHRPQWGVSLADIVYEYYTEQGTTRFSAVFYGQDAKMVAPIRSGRFFDTNVVQMYKALFVFGSAYVDVLNSFMTSDFSSRLILETATSCPAVCRYDPNGLNLLMTDTAALQDYVKRSGIDNSRQDLNGMFFQLQAPAEGAPASQVSPATQVYVRYSGAIYNRWDYDAATGKYLRFSDVDNAFTIQSETYAQLTDRLTSLPISADTLVMACAPHKLYKETADSEVFQIFFDAQDVSSYVACDGKTYPGGSGPAYVARDGKLYQVTWQRKTHTSVLTLVNADGSLFPFKPGQTWFEVLSQTSQVSNQDQVWRFVHGIR